MIRSLVSSSRARTLGALTAVGTLILSGAVAAHSGPPYPIVSSVMAGAYRVSVWTDPDTTDDGTAAGQFWVVLERGEQGGAVPDGTAATVTAAPLDRRGTTRSAMTMPVRGDISNQFAAVLLDHEGPFAVTIDLDGPLGSARLSTRVDATYDLRPPPATIALYLLPFVLVGFVWVKLLVRRRKARIKAS